MLNAGFVKKKVKHFSDYRFSLELKYFCNSEILIVFLHPCI